MAGAIAVSRGRRGAGRWRRRRAAGAGRRDHVASLLGATAMRQGQCIQRTRSARNPCTRCCRRRAQPDRMRRNSTAHAIALVFMVDPSPSGNCGSGTIPPSPVLGKQPTSLHSPAWLSLVVAAGSWSRDWARNAVQQGRRRRCQGDRLRFALIARPVITTVQVTDLPADEGNREAPRVAGEAAEAARAIRRQPKSSVLDDEVGRPRHSANRYRRRRRSGAKKPAAAGWRRGRSLFLSSLGDRRPADERQNGQRGGATGQHRQTVERL